MLLAVFLLLAFGASMLGGLIPAVEALLDRLGVSRILSFRSGLLVAVAAVDVLPEGWRLSPTLAAAAAGGALGLGAFLHRGHAEEHEGHELTHPHVDSPRADAFSTAAALFAHSLIDGLNLGASAFVGGPALWAVGAATAIHKLADGFTLTSLFQVAGRPRGRVLGLLVAVSLATPLGAALGRQGGLTLGPWLAGALLGFAGGSFLFVGLTQIVPHLRRRRGLGSPLAFAGGFAAMLILRKLSA